MSKHERFEIAKIPRADIKGVDWNPRAISNQAKMRLRRGIEENGLVQPLVWNKRTGNLVGGHQRLSILDDMEGSNSYNVTVSVVDLADKDERKLNVLLNNDSAMGHWDERRLLELFHTDDNDVVDYEAFGFSSNQADYFDKLIEQNDIENQQIAAAMNDALAYEEDVQAPVADDIVAARHADKLERKRRFEERVSTLLTPIKPEEWKAKSDADKAEFNDARLGYKNESFEYVHLKIVFNTVESRRVFLERYGLSTSKEVFHESDFGGEAGNGRGPGSSETGQADTDCEGAV